MALIGTCELSAFSSLFASEQPLLRAEKNKFINKENFTSSGIGSL
jgi:hypothetical protein